MKSQEPMTLPRLGALMERCQKDTLEILGQRAAGRLANWQRYESDLEGLVKFIKKRLLSESRENGRKLEISKKLSLERIVVYHFPELFDPDDIELAKATLEGL